VLAPVIDKGKVLKRNDGLKFFISNDEKRIPIYMEFELMIGAAKCELQQYSIKGVNQVK